MITGREMKILKGYKRNKDNIVFTFDFITLVYVAIYLQKRCFAYVFRWISMQADDWLLSA